MIASVKATHQGELLELSENIMRVADPFVKKHGYEMEVKINAVNPEDLRLDVAIKGKESDENKVG